MPFGRNASAVTLSGLIVVAEGVFGLTCLANLRRPGICGRFAPRAQARRPRWGSNSSDTFKRRAALQIPPPASAT